MTQFDLKIGFKCNNNCVHCVVADKRPSGDLSLQKILEIVDGLPSGTEIQITGGEPSIYKDELLTILIRCKEKGLNTILQTNATGFSDREFCEECAPYIGHAHVAIHSYDKEVHDRVIGCRGWDDTISGFRNLNDLGVSLTTQTVLSKVNIPTLPGTFDFIQEMRPGTIMSMTYPHLMGNAWKNRDVVAFRYSEYKDVIRRCLDKWARYLYTESIPPCYIHPYYRTIHWSTEQTISNELFDRKGVDFSNSMSTQNYNILDAKDRRKGPKCKECIYDKECVGVWKEYFMLFGKSLDLYPIKEESCECK